MSDGKKLLRVIRTIGMVLALGVSMSADAGWFGFGGDKRATVEISLTTNISSKVAAIGGLPKSVRISAVSGDGSVVVGKFRNNQPSHDWQIFRFAQSSGIENLGTMGKEKDSIEATCISTDGMVIWGTFYVKNEGSHIFRYTQANGLQDLGTMGRESVAINGVSHDGSVIVGSFLFTRQPGAGKSLPYHAFSYSQSKGFEDLGTMGAESAFARGISDDGSLVVGNFQLADTSSHAFRYSRSDGVQDLGVGGVAAFATGFSNNGSVIVGKFFGEFSFINYTHYNHVFIYTKTGGVQKLGAMGGRSVGDPGISADGSRLFGSYIDSDGESYVYTAKLIQEKDRQP